MLIADDAPAVRSWWTELDLFVDGSVPALVPRSTQARAALTVLVVVVLPLLVCWWGDLSGSSDLLLVLSQSFNSPSVVPTFDEEDWAVVPTSGGPDDPHFRVAWSDHISTSGKLRVVSGAQDHRFSAVNASTHQYAFPEANKLPHARLFQFHVAFAGNVSAFNRTAFWIYTPKGSALPVLPYHQPLAWDSGQAVDGDTGSFVITKLDVECLDHQPVGWEWRIGQGVRNNDLIVRCVAFLPPEVVDLALCINVSAHARGAECRVGHVVMHDVDGGIVRFPMDKIMHFPNPVSLFSNASRSSPPPAANGGFPTAPWRATGLAEPQVVRASSEAPAAKVRTCAWVAKKFSWDAEDELWLLWMLDIVGVDFVAVYLTPSNATGYEDNPALFIITTTLEAVRARLDAHPGLSQRVVLVRSDVPGSLTTHDHMVEAMHWDAFVRLQSDCHYGFSLDMDEFVELFAVKPPHERVDVRTFIAQSHAMLEERQSVYMHRLQMERMTLPGVDDYTMPPFLVQWLRFTSDDRTRVIDSAMSLNRLGKSLWRLRGTLMPYLHHPEGPPVLYDSAKSSYVLHIRLAVGFTAFSDTIDFAR